jgi:hypothetical protein
MRKSTWLALGLVILLGFAGYAAGSKTLSDKQRIGALEGQVAALVEAAGDTEQYIEILNARTLELHKRVIFLEGRGPVAEAR